MLGDCVSIATLRHDRFSERSYLFTMSDITPAHQASQPHGASERRSLRTSRNSAGGARRDRTDDLLLAKQALSQLSYGPAQRTEDRRRRTDRDGNPSSVARPPSSDLGSPSRSSRGRHRPPSLRYGAAAFASLRERRLVGLGRFELPTSRLSSARSNQLSYKPVPENRRRMTDDRHCICRPSSVLCRPNRARPRRKRNEDGGVPPVPEDRGRMMEDRCPSTFAPCSDDMFLSRK